MAARFIAFEGGEAAGKSTQVDRLGTRIDAIRTREPGGTTLGSAIRSLVLDPAGAPIAARAEALLLAADRAQHVETLIAPALAAGRHVITDRYLYSSIAYQAGGRGLDPGEISGISAWAVAGCLPDLVVFLDVPVEVARARLASSAPDRLEAEDDHFHSRVRSAFVAQAAADPVRWLTVDGTASPDEVESMIWAGVLDRLHDLG